MSFHAIQSVKPQYISSFRTCKSTTGWCNRIWWSEYAIVLPPLFAKLSRSGVFVFDWLAYLESFHCLFFYLIDLRQLADCSWHERTHASIKHRNDMDWQLLLAVALKLKHSTVHTYHCLMRLGARYTWGLSKSYVLCINSKLIFVLRISILDPSIEQAPYKTDWCCNS